MSHRLPDARALLTAEQCWRLDAWFAEKWEQRDGQAAWAREPRDFADNLAARCRKEIDRLLDPYVDIPEQPCPPDMASISPCFDAALRAARESMHMLGDQEFWYVILGTMPQEVHEVLARSAKVAAVALNATRPVNKLLPPELITSIVAHFAPQDLIAASHVCQHWRRIILDEPRLWNHLTLDVTPHTRSSLSALVARSQEAPLSLRIDHILPDKIPAVSSCVSKNLNRMKSLELHFSADAPYAPSLAKMLGRPAPLLTCLRLLSRGRGENAEATCHFVLPQELFQGSAPKLKLVEIADMRLPDSCPALATVTTLITGYNRYSHSRQLRKTQLLRLFQLFPSLTHVELNDLDADCVLPPLPEEHGLHSLSLRPASSRMIPPEIIVGLSHNTIPRFSIHGRNSAELLETLTKDLPPWHTLYLASDAPKRRSLALLSLSVHCGEGEHRVRSVTLRPLDASLTALLDSRLDFLTTCYISELLIDGKSGLPFTRAPSLEILYITVDSRARRPFRDDNMHLGERVVATPSLAWVVVEGTGAVSVHKIRAILTALHAPRLEGLRVRKGVRFGDSDVGNYSTDVLESIVPLVIMEDRTDMLSNL